MKLTSVFVVFSLLFLASCQEKSSKKSSSSCTGNEYWAPGCPGYNQYGTTSGVTAGSGQCSYGNNNWTYPGCPGYCQMNPSNPSCQTGGTTGTTASGSTGGTTGGTNPYPQYPSTGYPLFPDPNWGVMYPQGVPTGSASSCATTTPSNMTYPPYDTRVATLTLAGGKNYDPSSGQPLYTTSDILTSVTKAKTLFETDAILKVRFKARPQPDAAKSTSLCYGRATGQSTVPGYTKIMFSVVAVGLDSNGNQAGVEPIAVVTADVNSCAPTPTLNLSSVVSKYPGGIYLRISDVYANQNCSYTDNFGRNIGFYSCNSFKLVRQADCVQLDIEVAADGTKTF